MKYFSSVPVLLWSAIVVLLTAGTLKGQTPNVSVDAIMNARVDWHLAGLAEARKDWEAALTYYDKVSEDVVPVPLDIREWYRATAAYGKALCFARLDKPEETREALNLAAEHHFWNFELVRTDSSLLSVCGSGWLDSLGRYWKRVLAAEETNWIPQTSIVLYPEQDSARASMPVVIALHGGNACYTEFAEYWRTVADEHHLIVVVPPGIARESETTNSWGYDMAPVEKEILELVGAIEKNKVGDSKQIYLAGYSQGGQAALEVGIRHPEVFKGLLPICGFMHDSPDSSRLAVASRAGLRIYSIEPQMEIPTFRGSMSSASDLLHQHRVAFRQVVLPEMIHEMPLDFAHQFDLAWDWLRNKNDSTLLNTLDHRNSQTSERNPPN